jgi:hypothetical protein
MSVYDDMARDAGYTGDQAAEIARTLEEQHREEVEHDPCPMACGRTTEDPYGGPCEACWALTDPPR